LDDLVYSQSAALSVILNEKWAVQVDADDFIDRWLSERQKYPISILEEVEYRTSTFSGLPEPLIIIFLGFLVGGNPEWYVFVNVSDKYF